MYLLERLRFMIKHSQIQRGSYLFIYMVRKNTSFNVSNNWNLEILQISYDYKYSMIYLVVGVRAISFITMKFFKSNNNICLDENLFIKLTLSGVNIWSSKCVIPRLG